MKYKEMVQKTDKMQTIHIIAVHKFHGPLPIDELNWNFYFLYFYSVEYTVEKS